MKKSIESKQLIIQQCIDLLRQEDLKYELKLFLEPVVSMLFGLVNPYIYIFLMINVLMFIMILTILILLIINNRTTHIVSTS